MPSANYLQDSNGNWWAISVNPDGTLTRTQVQNPGQAANPLTNLTALTIITDAMIEAGWLAQGETANVAEGAWVLGKLNRMMDMWSAAKRFVWSEQFTLWTLTPGLAPHTIGPAAATFTVTQRPPVVAGAALVLTNVSPNVDVPLNLRDDDWWGEQRVKGITTNVPTDLFYSPDWPNGSLNFWPVPNYAYGVRLRTWSTVTQFAGIATQYSFPPGYREAITMSLAESLLGPNSGPLGMQARTARSIIEGNNSKSPRIRTADHGMPGKRGGGFNYYSGQ